MQQDNITNQINSLPESVVSEIAEKASSRTQVEGSVSWTAKPVTIQSIGTGTLGMWSVRGKFSEGSSSTLWNARIKVIDPNTQDGLTNFNHPSRELSALRSGHLGNIDVGLVPVPVFGITDRPDGTVWIWMKDLSDTEQPPWSVESYLAAARHVGMFNRVWPESAIPDGGWVNIDGSTDRRLAADPVYSSSFDLLRGIRDHKNVIRAGSLIGVERMLSLLDAVNTLIDATTSLPKSVAHNDMHARNLFPQNEEVTFAIDWASVGLTSTGVDAGGLAGASITWGQEEADVVGEIEPQIFRAYLSGLRESGWDGDESSIRLAYLSTFSCYVAHLVFMLASFVGDGPLAAHQRRRMNITGDEVYDQIAGRLERFVPLVDEGISLIQ